MRKWVALGVVLAAAVGAVVVTRPVRRRRPAWRRMLLLWLVAQLRIDWNPLSWGNSIGHIASNAVRDIENWARNAINLGLTIYDDSVTAVFDGIDWAIASAENVLSIVGNYAVEALDWVLAAPGIVGGWIDSAENWLWANVVSPAINDVMGWANDVYNWAVDAYNDLAAAASWVTNNIIDPILRWVENAENWVQQHLAAFWDSIWAAYIGPIWSMIIWLWDNVPQWVDWLINTAYDVVLLCIKAGEWIIWFGEHTFDELEADGNSLANMFTPGWIASAAAGDTDAMAGIEADFVRMFGG